MKILVTGTAGFIGYHLIKNLVNESFEVIGIDNINAYYDVQLKIDRLKEQGINSSAIEYNKYIDSEKYSNYKFIQLNIEDRFNINALFEREKFDIVCHLAAQAGVRYSIDNPQVYIESNIVGFFNIIENCKNNNIKHLIYASSSSVYGNSDKIPFSTIDQVDSPISLYAATKKSNELMAYTYSHLFKIQTTGLRFFTVYGSWGRPDMAYFSFTKSILNNVPIRVFNNGNLMRDFTYIDDIVTGLIKVIKSNTREQKYKLYNIGNNKPVRLIDFIETIEDVLNKKAKKEMMPMQAGDVNATYADISDLEADYNYRPNMDIKEGITNFVEWYKKYYNIN